MTSNFLSYSKGTVGIAGNDKLREGDRVKVSAEGGWRQDFYGVVRDGPKPQETLQGLDYVYSIWFDNPKDDLSEDGPYAGAEILSCYLEKVE